MSIQDILRTVMEFAAGGFIIWGFFNEDKFVRFEQRLFARFKGFVCHRGRGVHTSGKQPSLTVIVNDRTA